MAQPVRIQQMARLIQKTLGEIFVKDTSRLLDNIMVTVTEVHMSPDLGTANVYLSFVLNQEDDDFLTKVKQRKGILRKLLNARVARHLRKVPDLRFYADNSVMHASKMEQLFDELNLV